MQEHINQAQHNEEFLKAIEDKFPDYFFDWKITVIFYIALHYLKAYNQFNNARIGSSHKELNFNANPANEKALNPLSTKAFNHYFDLFNSSYNSRYIGLLDRKNTINLLKFNYWQAKTDLEELKKYFKSKGLIF